MAYEYESSLSPGLWLLANFPSDKLQTQRFIRSCENRVLSKEGSVQGGFCPRGGGVPGEP